MISTSKPACAGQRGSLVNDLYRPYPVPRLLESPLDESLIKKARDKGLLEFNIINIRDFATDIHHTCDDAPFGGGAGMVMKVEPIHDAMEHVDGSAGGRATCFSRPMAGYSIRSRRSRLSRLPHLALVCGRYEGVDERTLAPRGRGGIHRRLRPVRGRGRRPRRDRRRFPARSRRPWQCGITRRRELHGRPARIPPVHTTPGVFGMEVPEALLSGNHEDIRRWRRKQSLKRTILRRPDLMERFRPTKEDAILIREVMEEME